VKLSEAVDSVRIEDAPACDTLMVRAVTPVPLTVIVAVRCVVLEFAVAETDTELLFAPVAGETVSHASLLLTDQLMFDVISNDLFSAAEAKLSEPAETVRVGVAPACVTLIVWFGKPVLLTVIIAVREVVLVLAAVVTTTVPISVPLFGAIVSQDDASCSTDQFVLDSITNDFSPPEYANSIALSDTDNVFTGSVTLVSQAVQTIPRISNDMITLVTPGNNFFINIDVFIIHFFSKSGASRQTRTGLNYLFFRYDFWR